MSIYYFHKFYRCRYYYLSNHKIEKIVIKPIYSWAFRAWHKSYNRAYRILNKYSNNIDKLCM